jgi:hypothetical protein
MSILNKYFHGDQVLNTGGTPTYNLPNGGGSYNPSLNTKITPPAPVQSNPLFGSAQTPAAPAKTKVDLYAKYRDPKTGEIMTPEEYAIYLANKIPKGNGQVTNYAGDAMTNPDKTANQLNTTATNLNNARNDIATGTTDPYKVGNKSGIAYSPTELRAIEKAYAGIYDPALNDVFSRLKDKQAEDKAKADEESWKEKQVFATNESIRQWRATTGTNSSSGSDLFTQSQLNEGAGRARVSIAAFSDMDQDLKNFFINTPSDYDYATDKSYPMDKTFDNLIRRAESGEISLEEAADEIAAMNASSAVKQYYIEKLPLESKKKEGYFRGIWNAIF